MIRMLRKRCCLSQLWHVWALLVSKLQNGFSNKLANWKSHDVDKSEADEINGYNDLSGTVTLTSVTDLLDNVKALSVTEGISIASSDIQVTDTTSLADADTLNSFTDGEVTLDAVTDTFENVERIYGLKPSGDGEDGVDISQATTRSQKRRHLRDAAFFKTVNFFAKKPRKN